MLKRIAERDLYTLSVDSLKNRIYFVPVGFWENPTVVPAYLYDWKETLDSIEDGFTILADLRRLKRASPEVAALHAKSLSMSTQRGVVKTAMVITEATAKTASGRGRVLMERGNVVYHNPHYYSLYAYRRHTTGLHRLERRTRPVYNRSIDSGEKGLSFHRSFFVFRKT
jgi:hypothetical protein